METTAAGGTEALPLPTPPPFVGPPPKSGYTPAKRPWNKWHGNQQPRNGVINNDTSRLPNQRP